MVGTLVLPVVWAAARTGALEPPQALSAGPGIPQRFIVLTSQRAGSTLFMDRLCFSRDNAQGQNSSTGACVATTYDEPIDHYKKAKHGAAAEQDESFFKSFEGENRAAIEGSFGDLSPVCALNGRRNNIPSESCRSDSLGQTPACTCGFKVMYNQLPKWGACDRPERNPHSLPAFVEWAREHSVKIVHLTRRNGIRKMISNARMAQSGVAHVTTTGKQAHGNAATAPKLSPLDASSKWEWYTDAILRSFNYSIAIRSLLHTQLPPTLVHDLAYDHHGMSSQEGFDEGPGLAMLGHAFGFVHPALKHGLHNAAAGIETKILAREPCRRSFKPGDYDRARRPATGPRLARQPPRAAF